MITFVLMPFFICNSCLAPSLSQIDDKKISENWEPEEHFGRTFSRKNGNLPPLNNSFVELKLNSQEPAPSLFLNDSPSASPC